MSDQVGNQNVGFLMTRLISYFWSYLRNSVLTAIMFILILCCFVLFIVFNEMSCSDEVEKK